MKSIFEQNGGTYTKVGDYYFPNISLPDTSKYQIGKCGICAERIATVQRNGRTDYCY